MISEFIELGKKIVRSIQGPGGNKEPEHILSSTFLGFHDRKLNVLFCEAEHSNVGYSVKVADNLGFYSKKLAANLSLRDAVLKIYDWEDTMRAQKYKTCTISDYRSEWRVNRIVAQYNIDLSPTLKELAARAKERTKGKAARERVKTAKRKGIYLAVNNKPQP